jgi:hypothetical protein
VDTNGVRRAKNTPLKNKRCVKQGQFTHQDIKKVEREEPLWQHIGGASAKELALDIELEQVILGEGAEA